MSNYFFGEDKLPFEKMSLGISKKLTVKEKRKDIFTTTQFEETDNYSSLLVTNGDVPNQNKLSVFGDWFDNDTRTITSLLKIGQVPYELTLVDLIQGQHLSEPYLSVNPLGSVPFILENDNMVLGSTFVFLKYLANSKPKILSEYCPDEKITQIDQYMKWFDSILRPCVKRITQFVLAQRADETSDYDFEADKTEFF